MDNPFQASMAELKEAHADWDNLPDKDKIKILRSEWGLTPRQANLVLFQSDELKLSTEKTLSWLERTVLYFETRAETLSKWPEVAKARSFLEKMKAEAVPEDGLIHLHWPNNESNLFQLRVSEWQYGIGGINLVIEGVNFYGLRDLNSNQHSKALLFAFRRYLHQLATMEGGISHAGREYYPQFNLYINVQREGVADPTPIPLAQFAQEMEKYFFRDGNSLKGMSDFRSKVGELLGPNFLHLHFPLSEGESIVDYGNLRHFSRRPYTQSWETLVEQSDDIVLMGHLTHETKDILGMDRTPPEFIFEEFVIPMMREEGRSSLVSVGKKSVPFNDKTHILTQSDHPIFLHREHGALRALKAPLPGKTAKVSVRRKLEFLIPHIRPKNLQNDLRRRLDQLPHDLDRYVKNYDNARRCHDLLSMVALSFNQFLKEYSETHSARTLRYIDLNKLYTFEEVDTLLDQILRSESLVDRFRANPAAGNASSDRPGKVRVSRSRIGKETKDAFAALYNTLFESGSVYHARGLEHLLTYIVRTIAKDSMPPLVPHDIIVKYIDRLERLKFPRGFNSFNVTREENNPVREAFDILNDLQNEVYGRSDTQAMPETRDQMRQFFAPSEAMRSRLKDF